MVAFSARLDAQVSGIFTSSGGALTTVAQISRTPTIAELVEPAINEQGTVAFFERFDPARLPGSPGIIFTSSGGSLTTIADTRVPAINILAVEGNQINNEGSVAFATITRILTGSGGSLNTIADTSGPLNTFYTSSPPDINDAGTVAFEATLDGGGFGLFTGNGGLLTTIADTSGPFSSFSSSTSGSFAIGASGLAINNEGTLVFLASLDDGGSGIFTGSDPVANKVIAVGDSLLGSTVTSLRLSSDGLNNSGELAFSATLADGTQGIFRTEPVPEPASGLGLLVAISAFSAGIVRKRKAQQEK